MQPLLAGKCFDDRDTRSLQSSFHLGRAKPAGIELDHQFFAGRRDLDALDAVDRMGIGNLLHQRLIKRTLEAEMLLNFRHLQGKQIIANRLGFPLTDVRGCIPRRSPAPPLRWDLALASRAALHEPQRGIPGSQAAMQP